MRRVNIAVSTTSIGQCTSLAHSGQERRGRLVDDYPPIGRAERKQPSKYDVLSASQMGWSQVVLQKVSRFFSAWSALCYIPGRDTEGGPAAMYVPESREHEMLRHSLRRFLVRECPREKVRRWMRKTI